MGWDCKSHLWPWIWDCHTNECWVLMILKGQVVYAHQFVNLTGETLTNISLFEDQVNNLLCDLIGLAMTKYNKVCFFNNNKYCGVKLRRYNLLVSLSLGETNRDSEHSSLSLPLHKRIMDSTHAFTGAQEQKHAHSG